MGQELIVITVIIILLFLMYVYKKKCDEDYYINLIQSTQQQIQMQNFRNNNYIQNLNSSNYRPQNQSYQQCNDFPLNNKYNQNFYNQLSDNYNYMADRNRVFSNKLNNECIEKNFYDINNMDNKKSFKLEEFLSGYKRKGNNNIKLN